MNRLTERQFARWFARGGGLLILAMLAGCFDASQPSVEPVVKVDEEDRQVYAVRGVVTELMPERNRARIAHEEIPGYMAAMTMVFEVKDKKELDGLAVGDDVSFDMVVTKDDGWIESVRKLGTTQAIEAKPSGFRPVREVDPLDVGDVMPDYQFTNELGKVVHLKDFKGEAVAFSFIFTRCPFPTFCPRMSTNMKDAFAALNQKTDGPTNWRLLSITIDPEYDTPSVLKSYGERYDYDPKRWSFVTAPLIDVTAIAEQFGLQFYRPDPSQPAGLSHNLRTVVIDAQGKVSAILPGNEWKPEDLVEAIVKAAVIKG